MRVGEGLKPFGLMEMIFNVKNVSLGVKRELYERVVRQTVTYGAETWVTRIEERRENEVFTEYDRCEQEE